MHKPIYLGFCVLQLSKLLMYETYYDKIQPYFGQVNLKLNYMNYDSFVLSIKTQKIFIDLKNLENLFDFSILNENHELFSNVDKNVVGKFKLETPENVWIDEFVALRSKCYAFKCRDDSKNNRKVFLNLIQKILNLMNIKKFRWRRLSKRM